MFGWFRRKTPSAYAVAIRDSLINSPEAWSFAKYEDGTDWLGWIEHTSKVNLNVAACDVNELKTPRRDRRIIREGIEAWIAWSVRAKEPSDA